MKAMLRRWGGRGYSVREEAAASGDAADGSDPDFDFDFDPDSEMPCGPG
jgi:hypothetical protein